MQIIRDYVDYALRRSRTAEIFLHNVALTGNSASADNHFNRNRNFILIFIMQIQVKDQLHAQSNTALCMVFAKAKKQTLI